MTRISMIIVALCGLLASPVLGYWEYTGTDVFTGGPSSASDPYGTWAWWQSPAGFVDAGPGYIDVWGSVVGGAEVHLEPWPGYGLSRCVYAASVAGGVSSYEWVADGSSKKISFTVEVTISGAGVDYWGNALDRTGTCSSYAASGAYGMGGGGVSYGGYFYPVGEGHGVASSQSGTTAGNNPQYVYVEDEDVDYWQGFLQGSYDGWMDYIAVIDMEYEFTPSPWQNSIVVGSTVEGACFAQGQLSISNPQFYWGGFDAEAEYGITATSYVTLYGNIDDLL